MNNLKDFYSDNEEVYKPWNTNIDLILQEVSKITSLKFPDLDKVTQVGLLLDKEADQLNEYIENLLLHYTYKRIFNKSKKFFYEHKYLYYKDDISFKQKFQEFLIKEFELESYSSLKVFSNELLNCILSSEEDKNQVNGRPSSTELKNMKRYLKENTDMNCYLCGISTYDKKEKTNIKITTWYNEKPNEYLKKNFYESYKNILDQYKKDIIEEYKKDNIIIPKIQWLNFFKVKLKNKKSRKNIYTITRKTIDKLLNMISLNKLHKEFLNAYHHYNNNIAKIEHSIAVDWGGGKTEENLFVSCHKCNQLKSNTSFFTEYSINKFFINEYSVEKARKAFFGTLGAEALLSLKIKQKFSCIDCKLAFSKPENFYLTRINEQDGFHYLNSEIKCEQCLLSLKNNSIEDKEYLKEFIKIKEI